MVRRKRPVTLIAARCRSASGRTRSIAQARNCPRLRFDRALRRAIEQTDSLVQSWRLSAIVLDALLKDGWLNPTSTRARHVRVECSSGENQLRRNANPLEDHFHGSHGKGSPKIRPPVWNISTQTKSLTRQVRHWRPGDGFTDWPGRAGEIAGPFHERRKFPGPYDINWLWPPTASGDLFWVEGLRIAERFKLDKQTSAD